MSLSELVVPVLLCFTACYALGKRVDVYTALTRGAEEGLNVLVHILPSLIALLTAVYMLRASGALDLAAQALAPLLDRVGVPAELLPLMLVRPISGSAAPFDILPAVWLASGLSVGVGVLACKICARIWRD